MFSHKVIAMEENYVRSFRCWREKFQQKAQLDFHNRRRFQSFIYFLYKN